MRLPTWVGAVPTLFVLVLLPPSPARAFHEAWDQNCQACHGPSDGSARSTPAGRQAEHGMLRWADASSTCLSCHGEERAPHNVRSRDGSSWTAAGDFYWLGRTFLWRDGTRIGVSDGDRHGHNVVAEEFGMTVDGSFRTAPGGRYRSAELGCTSCHDPHTAPTRDPGSDGARASYRMLRGPESWTSGDAEPLRFENPPPFAVAPTDWDERDDNHVAYGAGMSAWCRNCHAGVSDNGMHPSGESGRLDGRIVSNYNAYVTSGDFSGTSSSAYLALVPFEAGTEHLAELDPYSTSGPESGTARVMCLTCHRAHASAFNHAGRWDFSATFLDSSHPQLGDSGATASDVANRYYGRDILDEFGPFQRSLCNKCHATD